MILHSSKLEVYAWWKVPVKCFRQLWVLAYIKHIKFIVLKQFKRFLGYPLTHPVMKRSQTSVKWKCFSPFEKSHQSPMGMKNTTSIHMYKICVTFVPTLFSSCLPNYHFSAKVYFSIRGGGRLGEINFVIWLKLMVVNHHNSVSWWWNIPKINMYNFFYIM